MAIRFLAKNDDKITYKELPENSKKIVIKNEKTKFFSTAIIFMLLSFLLLIGKRYSQNQGNFPLDSPFIIAGIVLGLICILPHEILHLLPYPKDELKIISFRPFKAYSFCANPISKGRFILSSLSPILLSMVPLCVFFISPVEYENLSAILWGMVFSYARRIL